MDGAAGMPGATGPAGPAGAPGATGATGPTGAAGSGFRAVYEFEEGSGTTTADSSGSGNNLTLNSSGVSWTTLGHSGSALNFDGASGYVSVPTSAVLNPVEEITVEAWVYQTGNATTNNTVIAKEGQYALAVNNGQVQMAVQTATGPTWAYVGGGTVPQNAWTHVEGSYDGLAIRTYVNGLLTSLTPYANGRIATTANPLQIGIKQGGSEGFAGRIDEVRILGIARAQEFRVIKRYQANNIDDQQDNGPLIGRTLVYPKRVNGTGLRVEWSDNFRAIRNGGAAACQWEVMFNGSPCPAAPIIFTKYSDGSNHHEPNTVVGTCFGLAAGNVTVSTRVYSQASYPGTDCYTGWTQATVSLEVEEVQ